MLLSSSETWFKKVFILCITYILSDSTARFTDTKQQSKTVVFHIETGVYAVWISTVHHQNLILPVSEFVFRYFYTMHVNYSECWRFLVLHIHVRFVRLGNVQNRCCPGSVCLSCNFRACKVLCYSLKMEKFVLLIMHLSRYGDGTKHGLFSFCLGTHLIALPLPRTESGWYYFLFFRYPLLIMVCASTYE